jgi:predicted NodU family carbamoyl transferase
MVINNKDIYVLGTGLSHDGSACLLKNGRICVAIEKERITRIKHDGRNDKDAILYCLESEGIKLSDLDLIVQNANFGFFEFGNSYFHGERLFGSDCKVPIVTISHHQAHAFYALGSSPYEETAILVIDGCGSLYDECMDLDNGIILPDHIPQELQHLYAEKDSLYLYRNNEFKTVFKDFSPFGHALKEYPMHPITTKHSIGGLYAAATNYCFGELSDEGKLMGLAAYGEPGVYETSIFELRDDRVFVNYDWMKQFDRPVRSKSEFEKNFQYYADIAYWVQKETEKAILYIMRGRRKHVDTDNLSYSGGVALNAMANSLIIKEKIFKNLHLTPAAGDNGLSIGCAFYGWLQILGKRRIIHDGSCSFGRSYSYKQIKNDLSTYIVPESNASTTFIRNFFHHLPLFFSKEKATKSSYLLQITITGISTWYVSIEKDGIYVSENALSNPNCVICTSAVDFIMLIRDNSSLTMLRREQKLFLSGDLNYFLNAVTITGLSQFLDTLSAKNSGIKKLCFKEEENVYAETAKLLAEGKVIGWFQDGCEFGPRALGNRSILADPRKKDVRTFINNKIKFREDFRPFSPAVLKEFTTEYFDFTGDSPFMILIIPVKENFAETIPGVVHVDSTARIQTVTEQSNNKFHKLISEFNRITGVPMLLNTSFNKKGAPIVETPVQALNYFFECALDVLVIDKFIIHKG